MRAITNSSTKRTTYYLTEWRLHTVTHSAEAVTTCWVDIYVEGLIWTTPQSG